MLEAILGLLAGAGAFLVGSKMLSDNIGKLADNRLRSMFSRTSKSQIIGVLIGTAVTMLIQSSAATTVMIIGFVNSGMMTLMQATAMIMGANIGTTITGQIAALSSFSISAFAMSFAFIGIFIEMLSKNDRVKAAGLLMAGFGLIFLGLSVMSSAMGTFANSDRFKNTLQSISNPVLLLLIGIGVTALVQSSSTVTAVLIAMVGSGLTVGNGGNDILFVVLGSNIGKCITAVMSSFSATTDGKRAAFIHVFFNVVGTALFFVILILWKDFNKVLFENVFEQPGTQVAMFHTFFNVVCTIIFLPFSKWFVAVSKAVVKDKKTAPVPVRRSHLDARMLRSPSVAIASADREINDACDLAISAVHRAVVGFVSGKDNEAADILNDIKTVDEMGHAITEYAVQISGSELSLADEKRIGNIHYVVADVVRVAELADNIINHTRKAIAEQMVFSSGVKEQILEMDSDIHALYKKAMEAYFSGGAREIAEVEKLENTVDNMRHDLVQGHIDRLGEGKCQPKSSGVFINLVGNLERVGDHLNSIAHYNQKVVPQHHAKSVKKSNG